MTTVMSGWRAGDEVELWGPLGNGFPAPEGERLLMVAGGSATRRFWRQGGRRWVGGATGCPRAARG